MADKNKGGRPSKYSPKMCELICERVATNAIGLTPLCKMHDDMPSADVVIKWTHKYPEFNKQYRAAKVHQAELLADSMLDLANDIGTYQDDNGNTRLDPVSVNAQRLKIDVIKWQASKLMPKVYGVQKPLEVEPEQAHHIPRTIDVTDPAEAVKIYQEFCRSTRTTL